MVTIPIERRSRSLREPQCLLEIHLSDEGERPGLIGGKIVDQD